jgi:hypothetical protein
MQVITEDGPHPSVELVTMAPRPEPVSSSSAVPPTCPKHRSGAVSHGQQRSMPVTAELYQQPTAGGPIVLPKLAVSTVRPRCSRGVRTVDVRCGHCIGQRRPRNTTVSTGRSRSCPQPPICERCGAHFGVGAQAGTAAVSADLRGGPPMTIGASDHERPASTPCWSPRTITPHRRSRPDTARSSDSGRPLQCPLGRP